MKKLFLLWIILLLTLCSLSAIKTGKSIFYADSYMLRARGVEAAYWNPANLVSGKYYDLWLPGVNTGIYVSNNALDLDTYNFVMSRDKLTDADKKTILDKMDGSLRASMSGNSSILGFGFANMAISSSMSYFGRMALSEEYLKLLLYGNTEEEYLFDKRHNDLAVLSFADVTLGMGGFPVPFLPDKVPPIRFGFSGSVLAGLGSVHMEKYDGYVRRSLDSGMSLYQDVNLRTAGGGVGFKGMLGLASNPMPNLEVGLTLDNLFGNITWSFFKEDMKFHFEADSLYASNIEEDFYSQTSENVEIEAFSTELPPELRLAAMWTSKFYSVSTDYVQGFKNSMVTSSVGKLSFGAQLVPIRYLPFSVGLQLGNSRDPWRMSYGVSLRSETGEAGIAFQSYDSLIPGPKSKGTSFGSFIRLWF